MRGIRGVSGRHKRLLAVAVQSAAVVLGSEWKAYSEPRPIGSGLCSGTPTGTRGGALLAVLWLAAALSAIAFSVANTVRTETERTGTASEGLRAYYLASGSIDRAILWLQWGFNGSPQYFHPPMPYLRYAYPSGAAVVEVVPEITK